MTQEEIIQAISDDKMMPFIQPEQLAQIVDFVIKNYKPSLPSNLDEAVNGVMPISYGSLEVDCYGSSEPVYSREQMVEMFKAGAEWMAGQGELFESTVFVNAMGDSYVDGYYLSQKIKEGEKVIIQIRKK